MSDPAQVIRIAAQVLLAILALCLIAILAITIVDNRRREAERRWIEKELRLARELERRRKIKGDF